MLFGAALIGLLSKPEPALAENPVVTRLIQKARDEKLGEDRYWKILLHYRKTITGSESVVDDSAFFLSPAGRKNPQAELEALIRTYFDPGMKDQAPPVCRFIARYTWVKEKLAPDASEVPAFTCPEVESLEPRSTTLVFPTYYLNSPASMFGHTFINVETGFGSSLLTNAVNYAADPRGANAIKYTVYGIFGGFKGYFAILPYYKKIQQYSDMDQRDIWEYPTNLTEPEMKRMVLHIRELQGIGSDYYFFDENCSYHLLFLLESARPELHLSDRFGLWTIPIDTVKLMKEQGLVGKAVFRPSNGSKIRQKMDLLTPDERDLVLAVCRGEKKADDIDREIPDRDKKIIASDLAGEYLKNRLIKRKITKEEYQAAALPNLRMRSRLGSFDETRYEVPVPPDPATGHDSSRIRLAAGVTDGEGFQEIGVNPSFTDLLNTDYTRREGVELRMLDLALRYTDDDRRIRLEHLDFLDIVSLFPRNSFFKPLSWKIGIGFRREAVARHERDTVFRVNSGTGYSFTIPHAGLFYAMPELEFRAAGEFEHDAVLGAGGSLGLMNDITPWWCFLFSAQALYFGPDSGYRENLLRLDQNFRIDRNNRLLLRLERKESFDRAYYEGSLSLQRFF